ncbi:MAG: outer membrane beta-barrel protein [Bacteroidota bacterium]
MDFKRSLLTPVLRNVKIRVIVLLLLFCSFESFSQSNNYVGFTVGGNVSSVFFNHLAFRTNIRTGLQPGVQFGATFMHFAPLKTGILNTGLQLSINYTEKGYVQEFPLTNTANFSSRYRYIEVPFSSIIYLGRKKTKIFINPGIYGEFLLSSELTNVPADDDAESSFINVGQFDVFPFDPDNDITMGIGGRLEAGIMRDFNFGTIQLLGNFSYTITNTIDFQSRSSGIPDTSNNFSIGASVGYFFGLGKRDKTPELTPDGSN